MYILIIHTYSLLYISIIFLPIRYRTKFLFDLFSLSRNDLVLNNSFLFFPILASMANDGKEPNSNSSYTLHHFDHPEMVLVSKSLDEDNFSTQHRVIIISLNAKSKLNFVDGTLSRHPLRETNQKNMQHEKNAKTCYYLGSLILWHLIL